MKQINPELTHKFQFTRTLNHVNPLATTTNIGSTKEKKERQSQTGREATPPDH